MHSNLNPAHLKSSSEVSPVKRRRFAARLVDLLRSWTEPVFRPRGLGRLLRGLFVADGPMAGRGVFGALSQAAQQASGLFAERISYYLMMPRASARVRSQVRGPGLESLEQRVLFSALVITDQSDYAPGSTAQFTATTDGGPDHNYQVGETLEFHVIRTDGIPIQSPPALETWRVTDGVGNFDPYQDISGTWIFPDTDGAANGSVTTAWAVDPQFNGASLAVSATGLESGESASAEFTDASHTIGSVLIGAATQTVSGTTYQVTVVPAGNGGSITANLTISGLAAGVTASFSPASVPVGNGGNQISILTLNGVAGTYPDFTVTATGSDMPSDTKSASPTQVVIFNNAPDNNLPGTQSILEESILTFSSANGNAVAVSDTDISALGGNVQVTLTATNGLIQKTTGPGNFSATTTTTLTGSLSSVNNILSGMQFIANANFSGAATLTILTNDQESSLPGGAQSSTNVLTINVSAVNDAPAGADKSITLLEDATYTLAVADFGFTDPNDASPNSLSAVKISTLPGLGLLKDNGTAVTAGQFISLADITGSKLTYTPAANGNGTAYTAFTFQVQDNGGTANGGVDLDPAANTITFNVTSVNDAPSGANNAVMLLEDGSYTLAAADFGFSDVNDSPANTLNAVKITTLPTAGTLRDNGVAVTAGQTISIADINSNKLVFSPAANGNGTPYATFTFQVQDNGGTTNGGADLDPGANTFTFNVTPVNDAPAGTDKTITVLEDGSHVLVAADFGFSDTSDTPANTLLAVKIATLPAQGSLTDNGVSVTAGQFISLADITGNKLVFTPAANANGTGYASFTFQVQDSGGTANGGVDLDTATNTMTFNVTPVNDAPAGSDNAVTLLENGSHVFTAAEFGFTDFNDNPANTLLNVKITTLPALGTLKANGTAVSVGQLISVAVINGGNLIYTPVANANGSPYTSFTFQVQDNGGTASGGVDLDPVANTMTLNVTSANHAPAGTNKTVALLEDGSYTFAVADFGFSDTNDSPANALAAVKITSMPAQGTLKTNGAAVSAGDFVNVSDITSGLLVFTPAANANGSPYTSFTFQVQDNGGTANGGVDLDATANTMTLNVTSVNDAPAGADKTIALLEDASHTLTAADFGFSDTSDTPANTLLAVKITTIPTLGTLKDNGVAVSAGQFIPLADITSNNLVYTPVANGNGAPYASFTFQVQDNGGTANGGVDLDATANTITFNVTPVIDTPTIAATWVGWTYDGTSHNATATVTGVFNEAVTTPAATFTYYVGAGTGGTNLGGTAPTNSGTYTVVAHFAGNSDYSAVDSTPLTITVGKATLTAIVSVNNKTYDRTNSAIIATGGLSGVLAADAGNVSLSGGVASFADKIVGTNKAVTITGLGLAGPKAGNYQLSSSVATAIASISALTITGTITADSKVYDDTAAATIATRSLSGVIAGDDVSYVGGSAVFSDKNAGLTKTVSATGLSLSGPDAGNYLVNSVATTTAAISTRTLQVTAAASDKVYDGSSSDSVTLSDDRIAGDDLVDAYAIATFGDKNVGIAKAVAVEGITVSGTDAANYTFNVTATGSASISARVLTVSAAGINKVYDGNNTAAVNLSDDKVAGDDVIDAYTSATFNDKNVGTGKAVSVTGISISGADAANYSFNTTASTSADITQRALTVTAQGINKVYDGNNTATANLSDDKVAGDDVVDTYTSATFNDKNVSTGKAVSVTGISISGADATNYSFNTTASTSADISQRALTVTAQGINKVYDGNNTATVNLSDDKVAGDDVTDAYTSASFSDKNVGTGKAVSVTGINISGMDATNYSFNTTTGTSADISQRALTVTAQGIDKVYDGNNTATANLSDDKVAGDDVVDAYTSATFNDKNVATGKAVSVTGISISGMDAANYSFNMTASTSADVTQRQLVVSATGISKVYDGNNTATVNLSDDKVAGDDVVDAYTSATFNDKNVSTGKAVSVTGISISGADAANYSFNTTTATSADITQRTLNVTAQGTNKVYDGDNIATVNLSDDKVAGDDVTDAYTSASFSDKNVGTGKAVSVTGISISGADATNYSFNTTTGTSADISQRALTVTAQGIDKVYDGDNTATVNLSDDKVAGDDVIDAYTSATFNDKNVGTGKAVSVTGINISGADAANYSFNTTASTSADISQRTLTVTAQGISKVYDGNNTAAVNLADDKVAGDDVVDAYTSATFNDKNVGTGKAVSVTGINISGVDAANYSFNMTASTSADVTQRQLVVSATGINKVYDGNNTATVNLSDDKVAGDDVTDAYTSAIFNDKNVGTGKAVSVAGISISGTDAANYSVNTTASTSADITQRQLVVSATGINKVYDGDNTATVNLSDDKVAGDEVIDAYTSATFNDKNVGTGKAVSVTGISISGADAANYSFNTTTGTSADITQRTLTVTAEGIGKVYDGNNTAAVNLSDDKVAGDDVAAAYTSATFNDKNVGTGKAVSVTGINISGMDATNYSFNTTTGISADISQRALTVTAQGINKVYDGNNLAGVNLSDDKVAGDDVVDAYTSATFNDKNVGTGKAVSVTGINISGADAANYSFNTTASTSADISQRAFTVTAQGIDKVYDGNNTATVNLSDDKVAGDDVVDAYTSATFNDKNVSTGKAVSVTGISISGADATNYSFNTTTGTSADITQRTLAVSATGINKVYDGNNLATVNLSDDKVAGDDVVDAYTSATFNDKNVGTGKAVSVTGINISGADAANYSFNTTASTSADISQRALTVTAQGTNKVYDGNNTATVNLSDDKVAGDDVVDAYASATFNDKNVGTGKAVSVTGISISGTDAANYSFNTTASTSADVTQRQLVVSATGINKVYDGNNTATVNLSDDKVAGDDVTNAYTSASFNDKNVSTGKAVSVTGINIAGADTANYSFNTAASTSADVTQRQLVVSATGINKVYDGNNTSTVSLSDDKVAGDDVVDAYTSATFNDKNVSTGKAVSVTGISISGADAANYSFNSTTGTSADITQRALAVSATGINKVYDGNNIATVSLADDKVAGDDVVDAYTSATFNDKNVSTGKAVSVTGISISGADAANYSFNTTTATSADITQRTLNVTAQGTNKVYDGDNIATVNLSDDKVAGDDVTDAYTSASFSDKNVGTGKAVSVTGISISGADATNYSFNTTTGTSADISQRALTVTAQGIDKVYDGDNTATVNLSDDKVAGDDVIDAYTSATFNDKNVGTGKAVSVTGINISGADAANYSFNTTASTSADISQRTLTVTAQGISKVYDGNNTAAVNLADDKVAGDDVVDAYTSATFNDKNVGTGKAVSVTGINISGVDAANYSFNMTASTSADVTQRQLVVSATGINKVYDGNNTATVNLSDDKVAGDDVTDAYTSAIFNDKNVGTGKAVSVAGISISGTDAANYSVNTTASTSADITQRQLVVSATGINKVYDGDNTATVNLSDDKVAGDEVIDAYTSATFNDKNVGTGKAVSVTGISISGADATNYSFNTTTATLANITPHVLLLTALSNSKVYDTNTSAVAIPSITGLQPGDSVTNLAEAYTSANVATGKTLAVTSYLVIDGNSGNNYALSTISNTTGIITPAPLLITADDQSKIFGSVNPPLTATFTGLLGSETTAVVTGLNLSTLATASSPVGAYDITASNASSLNYAISYATGTLTINKAALVVTPVAGQVSDEGTSHSFNLGSVSNTGLSPNPLSVTVSWGDLSSQTFALAGPGALGSLNHTFADNGIYTLHVTVTESDHTTVASDVTIQVNNLAPAITITGTPSAAVEGTAITLSSTVNDPSPVDQAAGFSYLWNVTKDGNAYAAAGNTASTFTFTPNDNALYAVTLKVTDKDGGSSQTTSAFAVSNVAPAFATITGPSTTVVAGQNVVYSVGFTDPGILDTHTLAINWGDGQVAASSMAEVAGSGAGVSSHVYSANGTYTITFTLTDKDHGTTITSRTTTTIESIYALNATLSGALSMSGNATMSVGRLVVDSNNASALAISGNAQLAVSGGVTVNGSVQKTGNAVLQGTVSHGTAPDPLAGLMAPALGSVLPAVALAGNSVATINPGTYAGITVSGNAKLTLNPGVYVLAGGGLTVSGNASISGANINIVNTLSAAGVSGAVTVSGNGVFNLTPADSGALTGILIYQTAADTRALSISGNAAVGMAGTIYAPKAQVTLSGNGEVKASIIADQIRLSGNAGSALVTDSTGSADANANAITLASAGQLLTGVIWVSVQHDAPLTADEQARLADAISNLNGSLGIYGLDLELVDAANAANLVVHFADSSPLGGVEQGVLGFTLPTGDIYVINGWNYFEGQDSSAVGADQYDLETVLVHEIGHGIGLEHSPDSQSAMFATLAPGAARRELTTMDLSYLKQEDETGGIGDALHAANPLAGRLPAATASDALQFAAAMAAPYGFDTTANVIAYAESPEFDAISLETTPVSQTGNPVSSNIAVNRQQTTDLAAKPLGTLKSAFQRLRGLVEATLDNLLST